MLKQHIQHQGWSLLPEHEYIDVGISGARLDALPWTVCVTRPGAASSMPWSSCRRIGSPATMRINGS
jgi:hypothetical protein